MREALNFAISENLHKLNVDIDKSTKRISFFLKKIYFKNQAEYTNWLKVNGKSKGYIRDCSNSNILEKFFYKEISDMEDLKHRYANNRLNKKYLYLALRNWLKFCDEEELVKRLRNGKIRASIVINGLLWKHYSQIPYLSSFEAHKSAAKTKNIYIILYNANIW
ncbi:hypothetical protein H6501_01410 [Candidatus Woesearchaeota archaeon]|nr:hypothetical protein [Candidatus Woesearchaeota archaeon]